MTTSRIGRGLLAGLVLAAAVAAGSATGAVAAPPTGCHSQWPVVAHRADGVGVKLPAGAGFYLAAAYGFQVYRSSDDGRSWKTADYQTAPTGDWEQVFTGPPPPASTGAAQPSGYPDVVYLCANSPLEVSGPGRLCYKSLDGAKSWSKPMMVAAPGAKNVQRPAFAAGAAGNLGITYYASADPNAQTLSAYVTQTKDALDASPLFYSGAINDTARPIFHDYGLSGGSPRLDFVGGAYDGAGTSFWAGVVKQYAPPANGQIATTGYVGRLAFHHSTPATLP